MKAILLGSVIAALTIPIVASAADFEAPRHHRHHSRHGLYAAPHAYQHTRSAYGPRYAAPLSEAPEPVYGTPVYAGPDLGPVVSMPFNVVGAALQVPIVALKGTQSIFMPVPAPAR
jgi:hypothetical protein